LEGQEAAEAQKLRKRGWSEAKIRRAQTDKKMSRLRKHRSDGSTLEENLRHWMTAIPQEVRKAGRLGLMLHWDLGGDPANPKDRQEITVGQLSPKVLGEMRREVLYVFTP
jgi:hypothetical protein